MKIDVIGHLGSRFSFATVAAEIARGLKARGLLGKIINFDDRLYESCADLESHLSAEYSPFGFFVMLPVEHVVQLTNVYKKTALYISPNSDTLGRQYAEHIRSFDRVYVPSRWCHDTIIKSEYPGGVETIPVGCENVYLELRESTTIRIKERLSETPKVLHLMTDGFLPGRKGTTEVIKAWNECKSRDVLKNATLTIHAPTGVSDEVYYYACNSKLFEPEVMILNGSHRGVSFVELAYLMSDHDVVVLPSRCEGFGMMILAALSLGIPTMTTCWTGQMDFLCDQGSISGGWLGPVGHPYMGSEEGRYGSTDEMSPLEGEIGLAPVVDYMTVADHLQTMIDPEKRAELISKSEGSHVNYEQYRWETLRSRWAESLIAWMEGHNV